MAAKAFDEHKVRSNMSFEIAGEQLRFHERLSQEEWETGSKVWSTALVLALLLEKNKGKFGLTRGEGKRCCDVGAGCGLLGVSLCLLAPDVLGSVVLTDLPGQLPLLRKNVDQNGMEHSGVQQRATVQPLTWGSLEDAAALEPPFDLIVGSDVIFREDFVEPLLVSLAALSDHRSTIVLCVEERNEAAHALFVSTAPSFGFKVKQLPKKMYADPETHEFSRVMQLSKKRPAAAAEKVGE